MITPTCYNQRMLKRLLNRIEKKRSQNLLESVHAWYATSLSVCEICGKALMDQALVQQDIGTVLDKADRKLFQYRNDASDAQRAVRRHDIELANRITQITQQVYELRNLTAKFLIRAQGPSPFISLRTETKSPQIYYDRALDEVGLPARELNANLDDNIQSVWIRLEKLIRQAETNIHS